MSDRSDLKRLIRQKRKQGWTIVKGRKHDKWYPPTGQGFVVVAATPSDWRFMGNLKAQLRRCEKPL